MARNTNNGAKREIGRREDVKGMARLEVCCSKKTQMQRSVDNNESWVVVVVAVLCLCSGGRKREMGGQQRLKRTARAAEAQRERRPDANAAPWRRDSISIEHGLRLWASLCVCVSIPSTSRLAGWGADSSQNTRFSCVGMRILRGSLPIRSRGWGERQGHRMRYASSSRGCGQCKAHPSASSEECCALSLCCVIQ